MSFAVTTTVVYEPQPFGWICTDNNDLIPFGLTSWEDQGLSLRNDAVSWKEIKVRPPVVLLTSNDVEFTCPIEYCRKKLPKKHSLEIHIREHLGVKFVKQLDSSISSSSSSSPGKDASAIPMNFYCVMKDCMYSVESGDRFFSKLKYLRQHYMKVHAPKTFVCDQCQKSFATVVFLDMHKRMCGRSFDCNSCNANYNSIEALQTHVRRKQHTYDVTKYKDLLKSMKKGPLPSSPLPDEKQGKDDTRVITSILDGTSIKVNLFNKKPNTPANLLPKPTVSTGTWIFEDLKRPTLKVDFGTQTVPMAHSSSHHHHHHHSGSRCSSGADYRQVKRKKSAETQTGRTHMRISTETQTASVIKRRRSNRKRQSTETQTSSHSEDVKVGPESSSYHSEYASQEFGSCSVSDTNKNSVLPIMEGTRDVSICAASSEGLLDKDELLKDLEVHSQTQTDPDLFLAVDDFDINLSISDEFLNFVTAETQTLSTCLSSSPTNWSVGCRNSALGDFPVMSTTSTNTNTELYEAMFQTDSFMQQLSTTKDSQVRAPLSYFETVDNETQTPGHESKFENLFGYSSSD